MAVFDSPENTDTEMCSFVLHETFCSPDRIADSGQCFRWQRLGENEYRIPAFGKTLHLLQRGEELTLECAPEDLPLWRDYLDLDSDYEAIYRAVSDDADTSDWLRQAVEAGRGIRILRQELWETVVSFLISQNNNIPRIKLCLSRLCQAFGGFPSPEDICRGGSEALRDLGLGYRAPYLSAAASAFRDGTLEVRLRQANDREAERLLRMIPGVGPKVAACILLYGLGRKGAFPRDVWVRRIEESHFGGHFPDERYPDCAGILQQWMFRYERNT